MSTVYNAPVSANEANAILGTASTKPTAKALAAKVAARAKAVAPTKPTATKAAVNAKIDAILGHGTKAKAKPAAKPVAKPATKAKAVKARKAFVKYDEAFVAKVIAFVKSGKSFSQAKAEFGCSAHWVSRTVRAGK